MKQHVNKKLINQGIQENLFSKFTLEDFFFPIGPNAYAAMCAFADFASQYAGDKDIAFFKQPSVFKSQMGAFVEDLLEAKRKQGDSFSLDEFIGKDAREAKKKIKMLCSNPCPVKAKGVEI